MAVVRDGLWEMAVSPQAGALCGDPRSTAAQELAFRAQNQIAFGFAGIVPTMDAPMPPSEVGASLHGVLPKRGANSQAVILTFDDGPRRPDTQAVVAELARAGAYATFFTLLVRARAERTMLADLLAEGHGVALHGVDHRRLTRVSPAQLPRLLRDARAELEDLTQARVPFFRPPYGAQSADVWQAIVGAGMVPVVWQRECREWDAASPDAAFSQLENLEPGMVVLAHDTVAEVDDGAESFDLPWVDRGAFTAAVLARLASQGLIATSLGRALRTGSPAWRTWLDGPVRVPVSPPGLVIP